MDEQAKKDYMKKQEFEIDALKSKLEKVIK